MTTTIMTSREFNQDVSRAKREALNGPVFITDRGRTAHVLLSIEAYELIVRQNRSLADLLAMPGAAAVEFEPARLGTALAHPADLSSERS